MGELTGNNNTGLFELTGKIMVVAILLLFFLVVFVFCLHLYAKWFWQHRREQNTTAATRRRRLSFAAGHQELTVVAPASRRGLDPSALKNIPVVLFDNKDGLFECAVCLCEVCDGEKIRFLPKCNHGYHVDCIDMWFHSHSTCPLCRNPVSESPTMVDNSISSANTHSTQAPISFPTNVLFWASSSSSMTSSSSSSVTSSSSSMTSSSSSMESSTSNNGMLVIDIPRQINEEDENKSPIYTRLRSLTRLLSGNRRVNPSFTPRNLDPEQGVITGQS